VTTPARGGRQRIPRPRAVGAGGPAPWASLPPDRRRLTLADVRRRCAELPAPRPAGVVAPGSRDAAVLVPLFDAGGEAAVILTKRPDTMPSHQGEIAFPGGGVHPDIDATALDAALREAEEEIGLTRAAVDVVAQLDSIATFASRFTITPFVGVLDEHPRLTADPKEVVAILEVALAELLDDDVYREERWGDHTIAFFELVGETVWGATARILTGFLAHLTGAARPRP
jgi:8-oxo-dGTP pyrophosphatase MutT (NUDIX family)